MASLAPDLLPALSGRRPSRLARAVFREHRTLLLLCLAYALVGITFDLVGLAPGLSRKLMFVPAYFMAPLFLWVPVALTLLAERLGVREHGERVNGWRGWRLAWGHARRTSFRGSRILGLLLVAFVVPFFMNLFGGWKSSIPTLHPFAFDPALHRLDRLVHGGDPWALLQPWLGTPRRTVLLDRAYSLWVYLIPFVVIWQGWNADRRTRAQFFITFALAWIVLGTVAAIALSSAGPCFYGRVTGLSNPYVPLMNYLYSVHSGTPLLSIGAQVGLWANHAALTDHPFTRISAMPSMHVAMPVLYTLIGWRSSRVLGTCFALYALVIFLGSIHLGWHYAVDGEVSLVVVPILWWFSGKLAEVDAA
ncbi:MAG TPA: phosphatase PAP2 family protein [Propionibacteriaceae bacterium]|jgi:hypothetical protein